MSRAIRTAAAQRATSLGSAATAGLGTIFPDCLILRHRNGKDGGFSTVRHFGLSRGWASDLDAKPLCAIAQGTIGR
jgi:hypothetical protein